MHDLGGSDSDWWGLGRKSCLPEAQWAIPAHTSWAPRYHRRKGDIVTVAVICLFNYFCLFSFLPAFKRKKRVLAHQVGFLHYNTDINKICMRSWQAPSFFSSNSPAPVLYHRSAELSWRQAWLRPSGQKNKYTTFKWTAKLVITAQRQWVFHSMILYVYIKYWRRFSA